ncbi:hypothetical protein CEXT_35761 [Caerostris extrusa]|uniref:Uncharacterized protein n=1 Tax=Caerostris extrusa TaxID=172846 RepID=A0AAV4VTC4_CAEEX|nr:hypothetical protein CEXT_35761 [Caerostris extrusa]
MKPLKPFYNSSHPKRAITKMKKKKKPFIYFSNSRFFHINHAFLNPKRKLCIEPHYLLPIFTAPIPTRELIPLPEEGPCWHVLFTAEADNLFGKREAFITPPMQAVDVPFPLRPDAS